VMFNTGRGDWDSRKVSEGGEKNRDEKKVGHRDNLLHPWDKKKISGEISWSKRRGISCGGESRGRKNSAGGGIS